MADPKVSKRTHDIVERAADWFVRLQDARDEKTVREWERWCQADPEHAVIWRRFAEMDQSVPDGRRGQDQAAVQTVQLATRLRSRRRHLKLLASMVTVGLAGTGTYRYACDAGWLAEYRTGIGEQRALQLGEPGIALLLNTDTAIDVVDNAPFVDVHLHGGELLMDSVDRAQRANVRVVTRDATITPDRARMVVRYLRRGMHRHTLAALTAGRAQVTTIGQINGEIIAGQATSIGAGRIAMAHRYPEREFAWTQDMLVAENMRLDAFLEELGRYRQGIVRCDDAVAGLRVTGTFRIHDTDRVLAVLAESLDLRIEMRSRYWVTVMANEANA